MPGTSEKVDVEITWAGGHRTAAQITRPVACLTQLSYYPQLAARARELAGSGHTTAQIAERLNAEGFRPPKRSPAFTPNAVRDLLRALGIRRSRIPARRNRPALAQHEWWLRDLAAHLGMPEITLDAWVRRGWASGYLHPQARLLVVRADPAEAERLRALHQVPRGPAQPPPLAEESSRFHEHRTGRNQRQCRRAAAMTALRLARLGLGLGPVGGDDLGGGPVVVVGDQDVLAEDLFFQGGAGGGVDVPGEPVVFGGVSGQLPGDDAARPGVVQDLADLGFDLVAWPRGSCRGPGWRPARPACGLPWPRWCRRTRGPAFRAARVSGSRSPGARRRRPRGGCRRRSVLRSGPHRRRHGRWRATWSGPAQSEAGTDPT